MFGSQRPHVLDDPVKKERRSWNRVPVQVGVFCQNVQGEDELCWSARVVDISRAGMKLLSPHRFDPNTTIRIGIRFPADPIDFGQVYQFLADHGIHETRDDLERTARGLLDYFNATFQFYGRKIEPVIWQGSGLAAQEIVGGGQDAANADAIKAAKELNVFADASAFTPPYADALVKQGVMAVGAPYMSRKWYSDRAPYAWSITPDCSLITETAGELYVTQVEVTVG